jgi:hypothetical protein
LASVLSKLITDPEDSGFVSSGGGTPPSKTVMKPHLNAQVSRHNNIYPSGINAGTAITYI